MTEKPYGPFKPGKRRFRLTIQAKDQSGEVSTNSLKQFIKRLARAFGFEVIDIREVTNGSDS